MREAKELFYDKNFMNKLDNNLIYCVLIIMLLILKIKYIERDNQMIIYQNVQI